MTTGYVHYEGNPSDPCDMTDDAYAQAKRTWLCPGCGEPRLGVAKVDVCIDQEKPDGPLNLARGGDVALAYKPFLTKFGEERVAKYLGLGRVYGPNNELIPDWVTCIGRYRLIVRGREHVTHRVCPECGRDRYFAMGKSYLYPQPPAGVELFQSHLWGLIVPEHIAATLDIDESQGVWIEKLPVLTESLDGLGRLKA